MQTARLNVFQRLVRQWDLLHPYNAAQVLRLKGSPDLALLDRTWMQAIHAMGLGTLAMRGSEFWYQNLNGDASLHGVTVVPAEQSLEVFISAELNRPFPEPGGFPFRAFVKEENGSFYAGVVYQHWVADSASIRILLHEWFVRMYEPSRARARPLRAPEGGYWRLMGPGVARWPMLNGFLASVRWSSRFKQVRRVEHEDFDNFRVRFAMHRFPAGAISQIHERARSLGCTLNDYFLAAIADACNRYVPAQRTRKRQNLALGTIVDLRPHTTANLDDVFGMFLGFTSVVCRPSDFEDFGRLVRSISQQNSLHKRTGFAQASPVRMLAGIVAGTMLSRERTVTFYRKRVPLAGGISNINLNRTWAARYHPDPLLEYIRVSPTGPMMPLVFTTSTLGDQFHFGLTCREAIISPDRSVEMMNYFVRRVST